MVQIMELVSGVLELDFFSARQQRDNKENNEYKE